MILYLAGNIGDREDLFAELLSSRLYSYHYLKGETGAFKEFSVKFNYNLSINNPSIKKVSKDSKNKKSSVKRSTKKEPKSTRPSDWPEGIPYLEIF